MTSLASDRKTLRGKVISDKMDKTIVVKVDRRVKHEIYGKIVTRSTKYHVHCPDVKPKIGDIVNIKMCRPISKTKSWHLVNIVE